jgi:hypothetical protein
MTAIWVAAAILSLPDVLAVLRARREDIPAVMRARLYRARMPLPGLPVEPQSHEQTPDG